jgi:hypothetical protein
MVDTRNILLGAVTGALAASAVLLVAHAITPSTAQSPAVYPLVRAQLDTAAGTMADGQGAPVVQSSVRPKDQSSLLSMVQAPSAAPSTINAKTVLSATTRECLRLAEKPFDISDRKAFAKLQQGWIAACEKALAADGDNPAALVDLKLSGHVQFGDKAGGCELATKSGDKDLIAKVAERCAAK